MSDMYAIKASTLTAIGDAVRKHVGETRTEMIDISNGIDYSFDYLNGGKASMVLVSSNYVHKTTFNISLARSYKIVYSYNKDANLIMTALNVSYYSPSTGHTKYNLLNGNQNVDQVYEFTIRENDTIDLAVEIYKTVYSAELPFVFNAKIYAYDQDGNLIGSTPMEVNNTMTPLEMAEAIQTIEGIPAEAFKPITGTASYKFANGGWDWFLNLCGDRITTEEIGTGSNMFALSGVERIPFDLNCASSTHNDYSNMFSSCHNLKEIGKIKNMYPNGMSAMFYNCQNLRYLPQFENLNLDRFHTYTYASCGSMFSSCYSLRSIPEDFLKQFYGIQTSGTYFIWNGIQYCSTLDEVRGLNPQTGALTSNSFNATAASCYRLKEFIFAVQDDGTPYSVNWKSQTIDLTKNVGYCTYAASIIKDNSGITADKEVKDDATYQALKDDPDWFACDINYSRYNHDSAVNTINSLPIITATGATNTIKFKGAQGALTDGGAINTLTEEEIAVAAAKGWTVSLV